MARISSSIVVFALAIFAVPGQAGPGCASRKWASVQECVEKCSRRWGWAGHAMGTDPWGSVVKIAKTGASTDQMVIEACSAGSSSSLPIPSSTVAIINVQPTPSLSPTEASSSSTLPSTTIRTSTSSSLSSSSTTFSSSSSLHSSSHSSSSSVASSSSSFAKSVLPTVTLSSSVNGNSALAISSSSVPPAPSTPPPAPLTTSTPSPAPSTTSTPPSPPKTTSTSAPPPPPPTTSQQPKPTTTQAPPPQTTQAQNTGNNGSNSGGGNTSAADQQAYLSAHNSFRAQHGAGALTWSDELEAAAQKWANNCVFEHSGGKLGPFGENLAAGTGGGFGPAQAVKSWTDESKDFDAGNPQPSHFTQVVWKGTTQLGCAVAQCDGIFDASFGKAAFHVCEYSAQGNIIGAFALNVQA